MRFRSGTENREGGKFCNECGVLLCSAVRPVGPRTPRQGEVLQSNWRCIVGKSKDKRQRQKKLFGSQSQLVSPHLQSLITQPLAEPAAVTVMCLDLVGSPALFLASTDPEEVRGRACYQQGPARQ